MSQLTRRLRDGVLAGFWSGILVAVLLAVSILVVDNAFAATFMHTNSWMHDPTCPYPAGPMLAGCEISDNLGFVAVELAAFPLLAAGVGMLGSAIGLATATRVPSPETALPTEGGLSVWRAPLIFAGALLVLLLVAEIALKLV